MARLRQWRRVRFVLSPGAHQWPVHAHRGRTCPTSYRLFPESASAHRPMGPGASLSVLAAMAGRALRQCDLPSHGRRRTVWQQGDPERPDRASAQPVRARRGRQLALMLKRIARLVLLGSGVTVLVMALALMWLKAHEDELVFAAARSRQHRLRVL